MATNEMDILLKIVPESDEQIVKRANQESWEKVYAARQNGSIMKAELKGFEKINGKLCGVIWIGHIKGILPFEFSGYETQTKFRNMGGQEIVFKVVTLDRQGETFVANRKEAVEHQRGLSWDMLREGLKVIGKVVEVNDRYIQLDVGGIEVQLTEQDLSYEWIDDLRERYTLGQEIMVRILQVNKSDKLLKVSHKELLPNPWPDCARRFLPHNEYIGNVSGVAEYGVFINLEPGVDCLSTQPSHNVGGVKKGDRVLVRLHEVSIKNKKIAAKVIKKV